MTVHRNDPLTAQDAPDLAPLRQSHEANQLESELKALFMEMLGEFLRPGEREINTLGTPHLGSFGQIERAVKAEGLALFRRTDEGAMRHLFRAWRARNPKRGLHILSCYLQLLWPDNYVVEQLHQNSAKPYPTELHPVEGPGRFRTSRVRVVVDSTDLTGADVLASIPALRSVVPARILLDFVLLGRFDLTLGIACVALGHTQVQQFTGEFFFPPT